MNAHNRYGITFQNIEAAIGVSIFGYKCECGSILSKNNLPRSLMQHFGQKKCCVVVSLPSKDDRIPWSKLARNLEQSKNTFIASNAKDILSQKKYKRNFCGNSMCYYNNFGFTSKRVAILHEKNLCKGFGYEKDAALVETYIANGKKKIGRSLRFSFAEKLIKDFIDNQIVFEERNTNKRQKQCITCPFSPSTDELAEKMKNPPEEAWDLKKYITEDDSESVSESLLVYLFSFVEKHKITQIEFEATLHDTFSEDDVSGYFLSLNNAFPIFLNDLRRKIVLVNPELRGSVLRGRNTSLGSEAMFSLHENFEKYRVEHEYFVKYASSCQMKETEIFNTIFTLALKISQEEDNNNTFSTALSNVIPDVFGHLAMTEKLLGIFITTRCFEKNNGTIRLRKINSIKQSFTTCLSLFRATILLYADSLGTEQGTEFIQKINSTFLMNYLFTSIRILREECDLQSKRKVARFISTTKTLIVNEYLLEHKYYSQMEDALLNRLQIIFQALGLFDIFKYMVLDFGKVNYCSANGSNFTLPDESLYSRNIEAIMNKEQCEDIASVYISMLYILGGAPTRLEEACSVSRTSIHFSNDGKSFQYVVRILKKPTARRRRILNQALQHILPPRSSRAMLLYLALIRVKFLSDPCDNSFFPSISKEILRKKSILLINSCLNVENATALDIRQIFSEIGNHVFQLVNAATNEKLHRLISQYRAALNLSVGAGHSRLTASEFYSNDDDMNDTAVRSALSEALQEALGCSFNSSTINFDEISNKQASESDFKDSLIRLGYKQFQYDQLKAQKWIHHIPSTPRNFLKEIGKKCSRVRVRGRLKTALTRRRLFRIASATRY